MSPDPILKYLLCFFGFIFIVHLVSGCSVEMSDGIDRPANVSEANPFSPPKGFTVAPSTPEASKHKYDIYIFGGQSKELGKMVGVEKIYEASEFYPATGRMQIVLTDGRMVYLYGNVFAEETK